MQPIQGIHHITVMGSDPQANIDFYSQLLGQRFVKRTVNFDDPGTYHLYYGDLVGSPGTIMTFFPWPNARRGRAGNGEVIAAAYNILPSSVDYWLERLEEHGVRALSKEHRFGADVIGFEDPDGLRIELITHEGASAPTYWEAGPIPEEHALRAFHGVTIAVADPTATAEILTQQMGYEQVGEEGNRIRFKGVSDDHGMFVDLLVRPGIGRGQLGAGTVHHVAFRAADDAAQAEYQADVSSAGLGVTEVKDRNYFRSIYFREPGGTLFEIATDSPGFSVDEPVGELGRNLKLPEWLEPRRAEIEERLPSIHVMEYDHA